MDIKSNICKMIDLEKKLGRVKKIETVEVETVKKVGKVKVEKAEIEKAEIEKMKIKNAEVEKMKLRKAEFRKMKLEKVELEKVELEKVELEKVEVEKVEVEKVEVEKVEAEKVEVKKVEVKKVDTKNKNRLQKLKNKVQWKIDNLCSTHAKKDQKYSGQMINEPELDKIFKVSTSVKIVNKDVKKIEKLQLEIPKPDPNQDGNELDRKYNRKIIKKLE